MSRCRSGWVAGGAALLVAGALAGAAGAQPRFPGVGRAATPAEIRAWDIDVRPDFAGLPAGSGSVARGQDVWEARCASCHGVFGESNQVFPPLVGGTTKDDIRTGRVAALRNPAESRTTLMKLSTVSTLWDYVNRAMPWDNPKTLSAGDVYAVVAYLLHLGDVVPADFVLSDRNIREVQRRLPNRDGMTRTHGLWTVRGAPDVRGVACMKDCPVDGRVTSELPAHARGSHGDLAAQHRVIGPVRGADTPRAVSSPEEPAGGPALVQKHACAACHAVDQRLVGPSFREIAGRYRGTADAERALVDKIRAGGDGVWGPVAMPAQAHVAEADLQSISRWILTELK